MFLVTTADERFWKADESILFLGEWCKLFKRRHFWSSLEHETLPYHWSDRQEMFADYSYLRSLFVEYSDELAATLNNLHQKNYSTRCWQLIFGPWLYHFIEILFDRYRSIQLAQNSGLVSNCWIPANDSGSNAPRDYNHFVDCFVADAYNSKLFASIIRARGDIPFEERPEPYFSPPPAPGRRSRSWIYSSTHALMQLVSKNIPSILNRTTVVESSFHMRKLALLQLSVFQCPYLTAPAIKSPHLDTDTEQRRKIELAGRKDSFEKLLSDLIPQHLPMVFVEGFAQIQSYAKAVFPKRPRKIFTASALYSSELFKSWTAECVQRGTELYIIQHGGHYGVGLWSSAEDYELDVADRYLSWGWTDDARTNIIPVGSAKLVSAAKRLRPRKNGKILWVAHSVPRYPYRMFSIPQGPFHLHYLEEQFLFFDHLEPTIQKSILLRLYPNEYGWNEKLRWEERLSRPEIYQGSRKMELQLCESRLFIGTYNATTFLETLAANYPTILYWNPLHWELRPEAVPYFETLREVGILHFSPIDAAQHLNNVAIDPQQWWQDDELQRIRSSFCERYARVSPNWFSQWRELFKS